MRDSDALRKNAQNCLDRAENASNEPTYKRFKRMAAAWIALAYEQDWLDGKVSPVARMTKAQVRKGQPQ